MTCYKSDMNKNRKFMCIIDQQTQTQFLLLVVEVLKLCIELTVQGLRTCLSSPCFELGLFL